MPYIFMTLANATSFIALLAYFYISDFGAPLHAFISVCLIPPLLLSLSFYVRVKKIDRCNATFSAYSFPYTVSVLYAIWFFANLEWFIDSDIPFKVRHWVYFVDAIALALLAINALDSLRAVLTKNHILTSHFIRTTHLVTGASISCYVFVSFLALAVEPKNSESYKQMTTEQFINTINNNADLLDVLLVDMAGDLSINKSRALVPKYLGFLNQVSLKNYEYMLAMHPYSAGYRLDPELVTWSMLVKTGNR